MNLKIGNHDISLYFKFQVKTKFNSKLLNKKLAENN